MESVRVEKDSLVVKIKMNPDDATIFSYEVYNELNDDDYIDIRDRNIEGLEEMGFLLLHLEELQEGQYYEITQRKESFRENPSSQAY